jgi:hypothetical protein
MNETRKVARSIPVIALAALAAAAAFVVCAGPQITDAAWTVTKTMAITATAVIPARPTGLVCSAGGIGGNITFNWTAPAGAPPSGYTLKWTGGGGPATSTTTSVSVAAPLLAVNSVYSIYADYGSWQSLAGTQTRTVNSALGIWSCGP